MGFLLYARGGCAADAKIAGEFAARLSNRGHALDLRCRIYALLTGTAGVG